MDEGRVVDVGIEVNHVERLVVGPDDRVADGVVATQDDWQGAAVEELAGHRRDIVEGVHDVGRQDVRVADVDHPAVSHLVLEEPPPRLRVVVASPVSVEADRVLPDTARPHPRAGQEG